MNKTLLATAVAGALLMAAGQAAAQVNISQSTSASPTVKYAVEIVKPAAGVTLNSVAANGIRFALGYNFSGGEVRYARVECSSNLVFASNTSVASSDASNMSLGAVNGVGTSAIYFSITDNTTSTPGGADANDTLTVSSNYTLKDNNPVTCAYSLYDQPSQAQAGGTTGRIVNVSRVFLESVPSYVFTVNSTNTLVANVEAANGAYFDFTTTTDTLPLGNFTFGLVTTPPLKADGTAITMADLFGANTAFQVDGDFTAAANVSYTHAGPADFTINTAKTSATRTNGATAITSDVFFNESGSLAIPAGSYTIKLNPVFNTGYSSTVGTSPQAFGQIIRNGTELQAPLVQLPSGWLSRMVLTNTGSVARPYTIMVQGESGNTITTNGANLTGTVPANGTIVVDLNTVLTGFTGAPRATLNVNVAGPTNQIQGLYQIVNPASGSISNHVMVRPGAN